MKNQILKLRANLLVAVIFLFYPIFLIFSGVLQLYKIFRNQKYKSIAGDVAVVVGGAGGLGRELCKELAREGCQIAVVDVNIEECKKTVELITTQFAVTAKDYRIDVTNFNEVQELNKQITKDFGQPATILVNSAGILLFKNPVKPDYREIQRMIDVNLTSHFWTVKTFLPNMKAVKKGHIVAISSIAGLIPLTFHAEYTSTKFAVRALMRTLKLELKLTNYNNINTTTVFPSFLDTNKPVVDQLEEFNFNQQYPIISGEEAAKRIVSGMLINEENIYIPDVFGLAYRLLDAVPAYWQDWPWVKFFKNSLTLLNKRIE